MTSLPDVREMDDEKREAIASRIQVAADFTLPRLQAWNYSLCRQHRMGWPETYWDEAAQEEGERTVTDRPKPGCRKCGIHFRRHQRVGIPWLYFKKRALLADTVGSGKTTHAGGLIAMLKETGELDDGRVIVCCRAPALLQWQAELNRMLPGVAVEVAMGTKKQRIDRYLGPWEVLIIGPQMLLNDVDMLLNFPINTLIVDDVDALRNRENKTSYVLKRLGREAPRMVIMTGTPLQKKLHELHSVLEPIGGREVFGPESSFMRRYVRTEQITIYNNRNGRKTTANKVVGYKNLQEFSELLRPMALRRTAVDIDDVELPAVNPVNVFLELHPPQRAKYEELKKGVIEIVKAEGSTLKQATALAKIHYGAQICGGLASLGEADGPGASVKLDWLMEKLTDGGDLEDEKVVVFMAYKNTIRAFHKRLDAAGIGYETVWGEEPDKLARQRSQERFWQDPSCKLLIGTQAIEQSLNLQVARHLVNVDQILNPARMEQLAGRIRRDGSAFKHVYVHNLLTVDTQEERYLPLLEREQALINRVWNEESELFEALNPLAMASLITG